MTSGNFSILSQTQKNIMKQYKFLFIDLDRTLWDFESNARETLKEIFSYHHLDKKGITNFDQFLESYRSINHDLWTLYRRGEITKDFLSVERFRKTLATFGLDGNKGSEMAKQYLAWSPLKKRIFPGVFETLDYLYPSYHLYIVTNGFNEVQFKKVKHTGFMPYFSKVITSDDAGYKKPREEFFNYAFRHTGASAGSSLVIGDDEEVDIFGAQQAGIDQVFVNYDKREPPSPGPTFQIYHFPELKNIL